MIIGNTLDLATIEKIVFEGEKIQIEEEVIYDLKSSFEFLKEFSNDCGSINWDKLIAYNSAADKPKKPKQPSAAKKPRVTKVKSTPAV